MNRREYLVEFVTGVIESVYALNQEDAKIIAMCRQIEKGNDRTIKEMRMRHEDNKFYLIKL